MTWFEIALARRRAEAETEPEPSGARFNSAP